MELSAVIFARDTDVDGRNIKMDPEEVGCEFVHLTCPMQGKGQ